MRCKNPGRIPKERAFKMDGGCYVIQFKAEGIEQISDKPEEDDDDDGEDGSSEDDLLDEDNDDQGRKENDQIPEEKAHKSGEQEKNLSTKNMEKGVLLEIKDVGLLKGCWILRIQSSNLIWRSLSVLVFYKLWS